MANVDAVQRSLLREIRKREDWMPIYEVFRHIMDNLDQQRDRSGGDNDNIADLETINTFETTALMSRIAALNSQVEALRIELSQKNGQLAALFSRLESLEKMPSVNAKLAALEKKIDEVEKVAWL